VDGKTLRGATRDGRAVHLLADLELTVAVVTADALHAMLRRWASRTPLRSFW
jgi:hypothetical protein